MGNYRTNKINYYYEKLNKRNKKNFDWKQKQK